MSIAVVQVIDDTGREVLCLTRLHAAAMKCISAKTKKAAHGRGLLSACERTMTGEA
jgi:hypothetical protein